jgi:hypothetical protein
MKGLFKYIFGESAAPVIPGLLSLGSWFASQYFVVPVHAGIFPAGAILGILLGYAVGSLVKAIDHPNRLLIAFSAVAAFIIGLILMVNYHFYVSPGHVTDYEQVLSAVTQLALVFACAGYLMPIAAITFGKSEAEEEKDEKKEDGNDEKKELKSTA